MASRGPVPGMGQVMVLSKYSGSYVSRTCVMFLRIAFDCEEISQQPI